MPNTRDISSRNRKSILSFVSCTFILVFLFMPGASAFVVPPATWADRTNFVGAWNSEGPCPLESTIFITFANDTQADVSFGRRTRGYSGYFLKSSPRYILALADESLKAPFLVIDEDGRLEAWHALTDEAPVCVYERED
jgi:hypothetical protein